MNKVLNISRKILEDRNALITATEISQQPRLWRETYEIIENNINRLKEFIDPLLEDGNLKVIFSGAGTSEFVGNSICHFLRKKLGVDIQSISTTDIVTSPLNYLNKNKKTLLISCARSGNSPESVATVKLASEIVDDLYQLILTCNPEGALAKNSVEDDKSLTLLMPEDSNDKGFAMTGSFTCMSLAGILVFLLDELPTYKDIIQKISKLGESELIDRFDIVKEIADLEKDRYIFLGSSCLKGVAQESALKLLELSGGKIISDYNSPLGFRHGPKSIVNDNTLIFMLLSRDEYTRRYELDLIREMVREGGDKKIVTISSIKDLEVENLSHYHINISTDGLDLEDDALLTFNYILYTQTFALLKSLSLGITPDNPCPTGEVNRVVKGVNIYNFV